VYLLVSCVFWQQNGINRFCDADDVISVTQAVNGGQRGIDSRVAYLKAAKALVAAVAAGGAAPPGGGMAVLHRGATGDAVALLQRKLAERGYAVALDGEFGAATELAVRHLQAQAGVAVDGVVGAETWALLGG
jgi:putative chitinase